MQMRVAQEFGVGPVKLMLLTCLIFDWLNLTSTNWQYVGPLIAKDALLHLKQPEIKISTSWLSNLWRSPFHLNGPAGVLLSFTRS
jgi:hypothetical protein